MSRPSTSFGPVPVTIALTLLAAVAGGLAGGSAGYLTATWVAVPMPSTSVTSTGATPAATTTFEIVPLENRPVTPVLPPAFAKRRVSSVGMVFRKPKGTTFEDRQLSDDRLLGEAVAVTSDGWFVTTNAAIEGMRLADLEVFHDGESLAVLQAVIDQANGTVFLKTGARDVTPSAFAHVADLIPGAEIWVEARPDQYAPSVVLSLASPITAAQPLSSEVASRRILLDGTSIMGDRGGAAWDPNGSLVGLVASKEGERVRIIPATSIATSLASLLSTGEIHHAVLGVRTIDLTTMRLDGDRGGLPLSGALIHDDLVSGKPGVAKDSPAAAVKLKDGDVILRVERDILDGTADLGEVLTEYKPEAQVTLRVLRDGQDVDVPVTLGQAVTSELLK